MSSLYKLSRTAKQLLALVPLDGDFIGNTTLQRRSKLGNRYWKVRKELVEGGFLIRGKGRGGSVAILPPVADSKLTPPKKGKLFVRRESELYEPLKGYLDKAWGEGVEDGDFFEVRVTGSARRRKKASGQWSRPDVTLVQVNSYEYLPQPVLEVSTFEVKKFSDAEKISSVYEAAAHSRWAHFSFLVAEVPDSEFEFPDRFMSELERFKIGLILMWKEKDQWQFGENEYETDRLEPAAEELNVLLDGFFKDKRRVKEFKLSIGSK